MSEREPRNPFYFLLLLTSLVFVANALAVGVVPVLEQKAAEAGQAPPLSPFRDLLRGWDGLNWLFYELAAMMLFAFLSMALDRRRSLRKEREQATINSTSEQNPSAIV